MRRDACVNHNSTSACVNKQPLRFEIWVFRLGSDAPELAGTALRRSEAELDLHASKSGSRQHEYRQGQNQQKPPDPVLMLVAFDGSVQLRLLLKFKSFEVQHWSFPPALAMTFNLPTIGSL